MSLRGRSLQFPFLTMFVVGGAILSVPAWFPGLVDTGAVEIAGLREALENDLRPRRPVEFQFIDRVLTMVESQQLPELLVR
ncbi:MAG TPA: hypothetical protein VIY86_01270 [Pirellulaceae bacterium]